MNEAKILLKEGECEKEAHYNNEKERVENVSISKKVFFMCVEKHLLNRDE